MTILSRQNHPSITAEQQAKFPPTGIDAITIENLAGSSIWKLTLRDGGTTVIEHYSAVRLDTPEFAEWLREKIAGMGYLDSVLTKANIRIGGRVREKSDADFLKGVM